MTPPLATPSRFLRVSGAIDPGLGVELVAEYHSSEESCRVTIDRFAGVDSEQIYQQAVPVGREGGGFTADVPLDLVVPGECGWRVWGLNYVVSKDGRPHAVPLPPTPLVWFQPDGSEALPPIRVECGPGDGLLTSGMECWPKSPRETFLRPDATALEVDFIERR